MWSKHSIDKTQFLDQPPERLFNGRCSKSRASITSSNLIKRRTTSCKNQALFPFEITVNPRANAQTGRPPSHLHAEQLQIQPLLYKICKVAV